MDEPKNLVELFLNQVKSHGDGVALRYKSEGKWIPITFNEWAREVKTVAMSLVKLGLQPKRTVSLVSNNRPEWVCADLGAQMAGGILVPIYPTLTADEVRYIIDNAESTIVFVEDNSQLAKLLSVVDKLPLVQQIILIQGTSNDSRVMTYKDLLKLGGSFDEAVLKERYKNIGPHDIATYIYTSGTTGKPKGAMLTHDNILFITDSVLKVFEIQPEDSAISFLPLSHVYERVGGFYTALRAGIEGSFAESIDKMGANLLEVRPTILCAVPRVLEKAYAAILDKVNSGSPTAKAIFNWALKIGYKTSPYRLSGKRLPLFLAIQHEAAKKLVYDKIAERFGGRVRFIAVAGAPMSKAIAEFFHALNVLVLEGYGMTECAAPATLNTLQRARFGTVGQALPGVELKIAPDGEILLSGRSVFKGYYRMPEETAEVLEDGWLHTGDIGEMDSDGMIRITDRKKDLIVTSGGKNVAPQKIENMLISDQYISQAVVIGDKRNYLTALISPSIEAIEHYAREKGFEIQDRKSAAKNPKVIELIRSRVEEINKNLAKFETVKDFRLLEQDLAQETGEITPTLKVKRKVVREKYRDLIEEMYAPAAGL